MSPMLTPRQEVAVTRMVRRNIWRAFPSRAQQPAPPREGQAEADFSAQWQAGVRLQYKAHFFYEIVLPDTPGGEFTLPAAHAGKPRARGAAPSWRYARTGFRVPFRRKAEF